MGSHYLLLMKYLITEGQYNLILESSLTKWVKRRANKETLKKHINDGEINFPTLCDDFDDEYEYADEVMNWAIDDFLEGYSFNFGDYTEEPDYVDVRDYLFKLCIDLFGEYLIDIYEKTCPEE